MDTSEYDKKIEDLTVKVNQTRDEMATVYKTFLDEIEICINDFYKKKIREYVKKYPDITMDLGHDGLANLKSECSELLDEIPGIIETELGKDRLWSHKWSLKTLKKEPRAGYGYKTHYPIYDEDTHIKDALRHVLGYVGVLLTKYDYLKEGLSNFVIAADGKMIYNHDINYSEGIKNSLKIYFEMDSRLFDLLSGIKSTEKKKTEAEAEDLWDSI